MKLIKRMKKNLPDALYYSGRNNLFLVILLTTIMFWAVLSVTEPFTEIVFAIYLIIALIFVSMFFLLIGAILKGIQYKKKKELKNEKQV